MQAKRNKHIFKVGMILLPVFKIYSLNGNTKGKHDNAKL